MNFLKSLFGRRNSKITYCGRAGLIFKGADNIYFVDSELLTGEPNIVVYWDNIKYEDEQKSSLTRDQKVVVAMEVKKELESEGMSVEFHPFL